MSDLKAPTYKTIRHSSFSGLYGRTSPLVGQALTVRHLFAQRHDPRPRRTHVMSDLKAPTYKKVTSNLEGNYKTDSDFKLAASALRA